MEQSSQPGNLDLQKMRWTEKQTQYPTDPLLGSGGMRMQRFISSKQHKVLFFLERDSICSKVRQSNSPETSRSAAHLLIHRTQKSARVSQARHRVLISLPLFVCALTRAFNRGIWEREMLLLKKSKTDSAARARAVAKEHTGSSPKYTPAKFSLPCHLHTVHR